jgi:plastocyanin
MKLDDMIRKLEDAKSVERGKPHLMTEDWLRWIQPHITGEEAKALEETIISILSSASRGSCEFYRAEVLRREIMDHAEDRAITSGRFPKALRGKEQAYKDAVAYERAHPIILPNPCGDPPPNTIFGNYYRGFWPQTLTIQVGSTVTWESREEPYVQGFWVIHQPEAGQPVEFDCRANEAGYVTSTASEWLALDIRSAYQQRNESARNFQHRFTKPGVYRYKSLGGKNPLADEGGVIIVLTGDVDPKELAIPQN